MKTFFDIKQQFLGEHHVEYRAFTRLLLSLSVGFIVLLGSSVNKENFSGSLSFDASIIFHLLSVACGVFVQHRIMMNPILHLEQAEVKMDMAEENQEKEPIEIRRLPAIWEHRAYLLQLQSFIMGFLAFTWYLVSK